MIKNPNLVESVAAGLERRALAHVHPPAALQYPAGGREDHLFSIDYVRNDVFTIYVHRSPGVGSLPRGSFTPDGKSRFDL